MVCVEEAGNSLSAVSTECWKTGRLEGWKAEEQAHNVRLPRANSEPAVVPSTQRWTVEPYSVHLQLLEGHSLLVAPRSSQPWISAVTVGVRPDYVTQLPLRWGGAIYHASLTIPPQ